MRDKLLMYVYLLIFLAEQHEIQNKVIRKLKAVSEFFMSVTSQAWQSFYIKCFW